MTIQSCLIWVARDILRAARVREGHRGERKSRGGSLKTEDSTRRMAIGARASTPFGERLRTEALFGQRRSTAPAFCDL